jgi:maleamate amidohydrolase
MDDYQNRSYGEIPVGFGEKPGIVVVDFQTAFTDPQYPLRSLGRVRAATDIRSAPVHRSISGAARRS